MKTFMSVVSVVAIIFCGEPKNYKETLQLIHSVDSISEECGSIRKALIKNKLTKEDTSWYNEALLDTSKYNLYISIIVNSMYDTSTTTLHKNLCLFENCHFRPYYFSGDEVYDALKNEFYEHHKELLKREREREIVREQIRIESIRLEIENDNRIANARASIKVGATTKGDYLYAYGYPIKTNTTRYAWGTEEQCVYPNGVYVYFSNGILECIQE